MINNVPAGIEIFDNVFIDSDKYLNNILSLNPKWLTGKVVKKAEDTEDLQTRTTQVLDLEKNNQNCLSEMNKLYSEFNTQAKPYIDNYLGKNNVFILDKESPLLFKYDIGGEFKKHMDDSPYTPRTVSLLYYFNDDYDGGELEFVKFNFKIKPSPKQLILFPSNFMYEHCVYPVTSGLRYSIVQFMH